MKNLFTIYKPSAVNLSFENGNVTVNVHGLRRSDFDALPGGVSYYPKNSIETSDHRHNGEDFWVKDVSDTLSVYTNEPPAEEK